MKRILFMAVLFFNFCFALSIPQLYGRINDYAGMLTPQQRQNLENFLASYEEQTSNQLALLTITSLQGDSLEDFSMRVVEKWKLGYKGKNNGALLLIVKNDRKIRIEVGYGLEPRLTDAFSGQVIRTIIAPAFRDGNYYQGIYSAFYAMIQKIGDEFQNNYAKPAYAVNQMPDVSGFSENKWWFILMLLLGFSVYARTTKMPLVKKGFLGSVFLPLFLLWVIGVPITLPIVLLLIVLGWPFTFFAIALSYLFEFMAWNSLAGGGRGGNGGSGGFSGGGGSFGGGGASGGW